jgi:hypothetical protein
MKVGKIIAVVVGGSIILLQVANHQGYIKVNWNKIYKQVEKVEEKAAGHSPKWMEKVRAMIYIELIFVCLHAVHSKTCHKGTQNGGLYRTGWHISSRHPTHIKVIDHWHHSQRSTGKILANILEFLCCVYRSKLVYLVMFMNICNHEKLTPCSVLNSHFCLPSVWP